MFDNDLFELTQHGAGGAFHIHYAA
jgi:hypothetical protein